MNMKSSNSVIEKRLSGYELAQIGKIKRFNMVMEQADYNMLKLEAIARGTSVSEITRELVKNHLFSF